jgi:uncharacterized protein YigE (DUF2233 family)
MASYRPVNEVVGLSADIATLPVAEVAQRLGQPVSRVHQLVRDGHLLPQFREGSDSCRLRSGIGVREDGTVVLAISNGALNFHDFAVFFRDHLNAPDALYLDGGRSKLLFPSAGRIEDGRFAGILAVVAAEPEPSDDR